ncbi:hypothetical protein DV735_g387, partial [Chaetothyriales sp. CBS 134920]
MAANFNWRTINVDAYDAESALNFDLSSSALETAPLGGDEAAKQVHLATVLEVLQGIRQSDASRILAEMLKQPGGAALGDALMNPQATGSATAAADGFGFGRTSSGFSQIQARNFGDGGGGQTMSVLLSWHEKLVELVGVGGIVRVLSDRRTV